MKQRSATLEIVLTIFLALVLGFFLAAGAALNGGGYDGYGIEHAATNVFINWKAPALYLETLLYSLIVFAVLMLLWRALDWYSTQRYTKLKSSATIGSTKDTLTCKHVKLRWFWIGALLLLICWSIYWLALWPGIFNYDAHFQYEMVSNNDLQTHHPLLHTLLLNGFLYFGKHVIGSFNAGVALYIGFGLVVCALAFSWMLRILAQEGAGKVLLSCSFLFLVNPAFALWLVSTNKDVLFTAVFIVIALLLYKTCRFKSDELTCEATDYLDALPSLQQELPQQNNMSNPHNLRVAAATGCALFVLVVVLLALRTSAVYSFVLFLPFAALLIRKHLRLRLVGIMTAATLVFIVAYLLLTQVFFSIPSGPWQTLDALSIPRQQLARVYNLQPRADEIAAYKAVFDEEELLFLDEYEADNADSSRKAFRYAFEHNRFELLELYLTLGMKYPGTYTDAALLTSYEAWYPGAVVDGYILEGNFAKPGVDRGSYLDVSAFPPATESWIFEDFGQWLRSFGLGNSGMDMPLLRLLCSPAAYMWLLLIVFVRMLCVRNRRGALVCTFLLVFCLTALLSPLVVARYYLMLMAATPLLLGLLVSPSLESKQSATRGATSQTL